MDADRARWKNLARHIVSRRTELKLTQTGLTAAGGPSPATIRALEGALKTSYKPHVLRRLERSLQWGEGSVNDVLNGGQPTPIAPPAAVTPSIEDDLREIADNPERSDHLRNWARSQLAQIAAIMAADEAEEQALGEWKISG